MNFQPTNHYPVFVLNIEEAFIEFLGALQDPRNNDMMYNTQEIFVSALRFLHFENQMSEAIEAMMIDIVALYRPLMESHEEIVKLSNAVERFLNTLHNELCSCKLYDDNGELGYTLGGWTSLSETTPYLIHCTQINQFSKASPLEVYSKYESGGIEVRGNYYWNPAKLFQENRK